MQCLEKQYLYLTRFLQLNGEMLNHRALVVSFILFIDLNCFLQRIPGPLFVLEIWKACFTGLIESPEGTEELKWTAFTFLKVKLLYERCFFYYMLFVSHMQQRIWGIADRKKKANLQQKKKLRLISDFF